MGSSGKLFFPVEDLISLGQYEITVGAKFLYVCLLSFTHKNDRTCYPSIARLAEMTNQSERNIQRQLRELEKERLLQTKIKAGRNHTNTFTLNSPKKGDGDDTFNDIKGDKDVTTPVKDSALPDEENVTTIHSDLSNCA